MREITRIVRILALIRQIWCAYPDWRLGQLLVNITGITGDMFYIEDDDLENYLRKFLSNSNLNTIDKCNQI